MKAKGLDVVCIGKIASIYDSVGVTEDLSAKNNKQTVDQTINTLKNDSRGLIFTNLVDFDMLYGHRRDVEGYAKALEIFDERIPEIFEAMNDDDLLIITADHGNDPTFPGSDHTREYCLLLVYGKNAKHGVDLGTRQSLSDIGQTIAENFDTKLLDGVSFLDEL
jgi:phosphopentomutase